MNLPIDIHTHHLLTVDGAKCILNRTPEDFTPAEGCWYSVGVHPWHLDKKALDKLYLAASCPQVVAIGETGFDKLASASMPLQMEFFEYHACLAEKLKKPLIIHMVRSLDDVLLLKKRIKPKMPWIIHGFRGKPLVAYQLLQHDFYLSYGEKYNEESLRITSPERLFLETDEARISIETLYVRAAEIRGISVEELSQIIQANVKKVFFTHE